MFTAKRKSRKRKIRKSLRRSPRRSLKKSHRKSTRKSRRKSSRRSRRKSPIRSYPPRIYPHCEGVCIKTGRQCSNSRYGDGYFCRKHKKQEQGLQQAITESLAIPNHQPDEDEEKELQHAITESWQFPIVDLMRKV